MLWSISPSLASTFSMKLLISSSTPSLSSSFISNSIISSVAGWLAYSASASFWSSSNFFWNSSLSLVNSSYSFFLNSLTLVAIWEKRRFWSFDMSSFIPFMWLMKAFLDSLKAYCSLTSMSIKLDWRLLIHSLRWPSYGLKSIRSTPVSCFFFSISRMVFFCSFL